MAVMLNNVKHLILSDGDSSLSSEMLSSLGLLLLVSEFKGLFGDGEGPVFSDVV